MGKVEDARELEILARRGINCDVLLNPKPITVNLPRKPRYEHPIDNTTEATERKRKRNEQLKFSGELKCEKIVDAGIRCCDRLMDLCVQQWFSLHYLSMGVEGRQTHAVKKWLTTVGLLTIMEAAIMRPRNITFDRYLLFPRKQTKGAKVEQFYSTLKELAENCIFKDCEGKIVKNILIKKWQIPKYSVICSAKHRTQTKLYKRQSIWKWEWNICW